MNGEALSPPSPAVLFIKVKLRLASNYLSGVKRHVLLHALFGSGVLLFLLLGGFTLFYKIFGYLQEPEQQPFGLPLMRRLIGMVLLAFFSMLTFSNLIIMLTTSYISREVEFYIAQPVEHRRLFFWKLGESTLYSSWAFVVLSMPFFLALGAASQPAAPKGFYPLTALLLIPYIAIPSALGAIATLILTVYFPAKRTFRLILGLGGLAVILATLTGRFTRMGRGREEIGRIMNFTGVGDSAWLPSTWLGRGLRAGLEGKWQESAFWGAMLISTALLAFMLCYWLAGPLYYEGFCASRSSGTSGRRRSGGFYRFFDALTKPLSPNIRSLVVKDLTVFWRDPAQWGQLVVLFALLFLYIINLGTAADFQKLLASPFWRSLLSLFNIGATCFVLSILSTRFFYPMLSLEGKQQWVIGLAPLHRTRLVWVKYGVCWSCSVLLTLPLILFSCAVLGVDGETTLISIITSVTMAFGLTSLAIGLGALMPNFQEDNPSRIANGLGGTINVILSVIYIGLTVVLEGPLVFLRLGRGYMEDHTRSLMIMGSIGGWLLVQAIVIFVPMKLGLRNWRRLEF